MTLKTEVMMLKTLLCITGINYILKNILKENCYFHLEEYVTKLLFLLYLDK